MKYAYEEKHLVNCGDCDTTSKMKVSAMVLFAQEMSFSGAEVIGYGKDKVIDKGMSWIITRSKLVLNRRPSYAENVTLITYPNPISRIIFPRQYRMLDEQGNILFTMVSDFVIIDSNTRKLLLPSQTGLDSCVGENLEGECPLPGAIKEAENLEHVDSVKVKYSDIDINHHLNNVRYIETIFNVHESKWYEEHQLKEIQIDYHKETYEGTTIEVYKSALVDDKEQIVGKVDGNTIFVAELQY